MKKYLFLLLLAIGFLPLHAQQFNGTTSGQIVLEGTTENYTFGSSSVYSYVSTRPNGLAVSFRSKLPSFDKAQNATVQMFNKTLNTAENQEFVFTGDGLTTEKAKVNKPLKTSLNGKLQFGRVTIPATMPITITTDGKQFTYKAELLVDMASLGLEKNNDKLTGKVWFHFSETSKR